MFRDIIQLMYPAVLALHSWLRWVVLLLGIAALVRSFGAARGGASRDAMGLLFTIALDIQLLVGLTLYLFLSPNTHAAMQHLGDAMKTAPVRFWLVEHPTTMVLALIFAHLGRIKPQRQALFLALAVVLLLVGMPWPGLPYGRPFFRLP